MSRIKIKKKPAVLSRYATVVVQPIQEDSSSEPPELPGARLETVTEDADNSDWDALAKRKT